MGFYSVQHPHLEEFVLWQRPRKKPILAQRVKAKRMSLLYEYTIASFNRKDFIREVSRLISEKPTLVSEVKVSSRGVALYLQIYSVSSPSHPEDQQQKVRFRGWENIYM